MKVTNHQQGNYTFVSREDSNVMYGTIEMSRKEFTEAITYLGRVKGATKNTYVRDSLGHLFSYTLPSFSKRYPSNRISLGVCATDLVFKKYKLSRYKRQNYVVVIK